MTTETRQLQLLNEQLTAENSLLKARITQLEARIVELEVRLNANSSNSNRPPSSDGLRKKPAFPKINKGKQGGQVGHPGKTLKMVAAPDKVVQCIASKCRCGAELGNSQSRIVERRQVFELPEPRLSVTEYQVCESVCGNCRRIERGEFPAQVTAPVQYGTRVKALAVMLNNSYKIPFKKVQGLFSDLYGYELNQSTVVSANAECFEKLEPTEQKIKEQIIGSLAAHADETGLRVGGLLHWLHTVSTEEWTYLFVDKKRGKEALEGEKSLLTRLKNWLVHDCWASYFGFKNVRHALCGAHLLRELQSVGEMGSHWAFDFQRYLLGVYETEFESRVENRESIEAEYDRLCEQGHESEPEGVKVNAKGRAKKSKGRNLLERLIKHKEAVLAFAFEKEVPFTNNQAERDIRPVKLKQKISGCFRTIEGADVYARIEGFVSTARKQGRSVFKELCRVFEGDSFVTTHPT